MSANQGPVWTDTTYAAPRSKAKWIPIEELREIQPRSAHAYWQAKRGARLMPHPKDINPAEIPKLLPYIGLVDVLNEDPADYFYRLEGEMVRSTIGFTRMGHRFSEFKEFLGPVFPRAAERLATAAASTEPLAQTSMLAGIGRAFFTIETVFLPLSKDGTKVDRIMMCMGILSRPENTQNFRAT